MLYKNKNSYFKLSFCKGVNLIEQLDEANEIIDKMVYRDVSNENLKNEVECLHKEITDYKLQIERLRET